MDVWFETAGVALLACLGLLMGRWFSRQGKPVWLLGYAIPLSLVIMIAAARISSRLEFIPPFSWVMAGRTEFALSAIVITMVLVTPLSRLPRQRDRRAVLGLMSVMLLYESIVPFLAPAFNRSYWLQAQNRFDRNEICLQSTDYDCGPAAAVTALRMLGFEANEGEIAILSHCSSALGTPPDMLSDALRKRFSGRGLVCKYRYFDSIDDLREAGPVLAVIRYGMLVDHYLTVLRVGEENIIVADPSSGMVSYSRAVFEKNWRHTGIQLNRETRVLAIGYSSGLASSSSLPDAVTIAPFAD